ncbi:MAG: efflux RND transporter periplasmic adaptor subunit [Oscillospiraceae bacterium]|jgi:RND family efflux transporter MFP subunit|nr:efflux RND transporter periplasmic adaptor subunit [Oscillospiraceae bacterium]
MKKKIIVGAVAALVVAGLVTTVVLARQPEIPAVRSMSLERVDLQELVEISGNVQSDEKKEVYTTLSYPVQDIHVKVGDKVKAGDVLCALDTRELVSQIEIRTAQLNAAQTSADDKIRQTQTQLNNAQSALENNLNPNLLDSEASIARASNALKEAQITYDAALRAYNDSLNSADSSSSSEVSSSSTKIGELEIPVSRYGSLAMPFPLAEAGVPDGLSPGYNGSIDINLNTSALEFEIQGLQDLLEQLTGLSSMSAMSGLGASGGASTKDLKDVLDKATIALDNARLNLQNATNSRAALINSTNQQIQGYRDSITSAQIAANFEADYLQLQKLQDDLLRATISAPISGTVTAVNAKVGVPGTSGIMFTVENLDRLKINTTIKEFDIGSVALGQKVIIKSDATGDEEYEGEISMIAPTIKANSQTSEFESEVRVSSKNTGLRVGMSTRMNIVTNEKKQALAVPYEALAYDDGGADIVYIAELQSDGTYTARQIPVKLGIETDFYIELLESPLKDGDIVLLEPALVRDGDRISLRDRNAMDAASANDVDALLGMRPNR